MLEYERDTCKSSIRLKLELFPSGIALRGRLHDTRGTYNDPRTQRPEFPRISGFHTHLKFPYNLEVTLFVNYNKYA
jgi:hypothetical protein